MSLQTELDQLHERQRIVRDARTYLAGCALILHGLTNDVAPHDMQLSRHNLMCAVREDTDLLLAELAKAQENPTP